jgi:hypothetical protein
MPDHATMPHHADRTTRPFLPARAEPFAPHAPRDPHLSRDRVQDLVDGEAARADELAHLASCPRCAGEVRVYQHVVALVRELARATRRDPRLLALTGRQCLTDVNDPQE